MTWYDVEQGDCMNSIAKDHGFFWDTLWNASQNADLKNKRKDPDVLLEGDQVYIPDKTLKQESAATDQKHTYQRRGVPAMLRLQLLDADHKPRTGLNYTLTIDGKSKKGTTDGKGMVIQPIPPDATEGILDVQAGKKTERYVLRLGHLNPSDDLSGVQHRLRNLGFAIPAETGELDQHTVDALKQFQQQNNIQVTGQADDPTMQKLKNLHGS